MIEPAIHPSSKPCALPIPINATPMVATVVHEEPIIKLTNAHNKLLLTKKEIRALESATKQTGYTIVPLLVFIDNKGRAKMDLALCKGKKEYDKRQTLKEKEDRREMDRAIKHY